MSHRPTAHRGAKPIEQIALLSAIFNEVHVDQDGIMTLSLDAVSAVTRGVK